MKLENSLPDEDWKEIAEAPGYAVSNLGRVVTLETMRIRTCTLNQQGVLMVNLNTLGAQKQRGVAKLVATAFIPQPNEHFNTPINLDGDRTNCSVANLEWRPRWFAVDYHKQFRPEQQARAFAHRRAVMDVDSEVVYESTWAAATAFGLLDKDIYLSIYNGTIVFPTFQRFVFVEEE